MRIRSAAEAASPPRRLAQLAQLLLAVGVPSVVALTGVGCGSQSALLDNQPLGQVRSVAVLEFTGATGIGGARPGDVLSNAVVQQLQLELPSITIVERSRIDRAINEIKYDEVGLTDGVAKLGQLLDVDALILGDTLQYSQDNVGRSTLYNVGASMRIVQVSDGRVIYSASGSSIRTDSFGPAAEEAATQMLRPLVTGLQGKTKRGRR